MNKLDKKTAMQQIAFDWLCKEYGTNWYSDDTVNSLAELLKQTQEKAILEYIKSHQTFHDVEDYYKEEEDWDELEIMKRNAEMEW